MIYKLGETKDEIHIDTADENRHYALSLVAQASHNVDIFTQDLDAEIYNNKEFEKSIFELAKKHPTTRIRILCQNSDKAIKNGHCLIRLAQNITSSVFIHTPSYEHKSEQCAFLIVDNVGLLHRVTAGNRNFNAVVNFMSPQDAGKLTDFFNVAWEHSTPDIQIRRMHI